jgi:class 3 adenylate cyclase
MRVTFKGRLLPVLLLTPQIAVTLVFFFWPAARAVWQSLFISDPFGLSTRFVGLGVLGAYYSCLGVELRCFEATIGHFAGDGLMAFFNDPLPCPDHPARAVRAAVSMQEHVGGLMEGWRERGFELGFGVGIASGDATLGHIGSQEQFHYTAIGPVVNLASRLCDEAETVQILLDQAAASALEGVARAVLIAERPLKGFREPIRIFQLNAGPGATSDH